MMIIMIIVMIYDDIMMGVQPSKMFFGQDALEENNDGLVESYVDGISKKRP